MSKSNRQEIRRAWGIIQKDMVTAQAMIDLIEAYPGLLVIIRGSGDDVEYLAVSLGFQEITGYTATEIKAMKLSELCHPDDFVREPDTTKQAIDGPWEEVPFRWRKKAGGWVPLIWEGTQKPADANGYVLASAAVVEEA